MKWTLGDQGTVGRVVGEIQDDPDMERGGEIVELIKRVLILATLGCTLAKHTHAHRHTHTHTRSHTGPHTVTEVEPCCLRAFRIC